MVSTSHKTHALYYSQYCFFCQRVLRFLRGNDQQVELRNTSDIRHHTALAQGGGRTQVPCLLIESEEGQTQWMYESGDIIEYLRKRIS